MPVIVLSPSSTFSVTLMSPAIAAGFDAPERVDEHRESRWNDGEARLLRQHVEKLLAAGLLIALLLKRNPQIIMSRRVLRICGQSLTELRLRILEPTQINQHPTQITSRLKTTWIKRK